jgi:hypothetical protein
MTIDVRQGTTGPPRQELRRRVLDAGTIGRQERDGLLYELLLGYRSGERSAWSPLILKLLDTPIRIRVSRYRPVGPVMAIEDVYQQLSIELLRDALSIPLTGPAFLERRLMLRSADRVSRWLQREHLRSLETESLEAWVEEHEADEEADEDA